MKKIYNKGDFVGGFLFLAVGLFLAYQSLLLRIWAFSEPKEGFFPLFSAVVIVLISLMLILRSLKFSKLREKKGLEKLDTPELKEFLWGESFGADWYFAETVGSVDEEVARRYIREQRR